MLEKCCLATAGRTDDGEMLVFESRDSKEVPDQVLPSAKVFRQNTERIGCCLVRWLWSKCEFNEDMFEGECIDTLRGEALDVEVAVGVDQVLVVAASVVGEHLTDGGDERVNHRWRNAVGKVYTEFEGEGEESEDDETDNDDDSE